MFLTCFREHFVYSPAAETSSYREIITYLVRFLFLPWSLIPHFTVHNSTEKKISFFVLNSKCFLWSFLLSQAIIHAKETHFSTLLDYFIFFRKYSCCLYYFFGRKSSPALRLSSCLSRGTQIWTTEDSLRSYIISSSSHIPFKNVISII